MAEVRGHMGKRECEKGRGGVRGGDVVKENPPERTLLGKRHRSSESQADATSRSVSAWPPRLIAGCARKVCSCWGCTQGVFLLGVYAWCVPAGCARKVCSRWVCTQSVVPLGVYARYVPGRCVCKVCSRWVYMQDVFPLGVYARCVPAGCVRIVWSRCVCT